MRSVLQKVDEQNIAMIVTDCVYSPGKQNPDASEFLTTQQTGLKNIFVRKLDQQPVCFLMFQLKSEFRGSYFDRFNTPHTLNGDLRPYYIMIAATPDHLAAIDREKLFDQVKWHIENELVFEPVLAGQEADVKLTRDRLIGTCEMDNTVKPRTIRNAAISENDKDEKQFAFCAAFSFKSVFAPLHYVIDTANYIVSNQEYSFTIQPFDSIKNKLQYQGFQYGMRLSTNKLVEDQLNIQLRSRVPPWVFQCTSSDDTGIIQDEAEKNKTFGLEYFVGGIYDAYCMHNNRLGNSANPYYVLGQFTISIKTEK
jgi:hypothetical protein